MLLGTELETGRRVSVDHKIRSTHMHVIGSTGTGKSKFLEAMIRQDIEDKQGLCLIDPHGYLYNDLVNWAETNHLLNRRKIVLFDPSEEKWTFGFNPLKLTADNLSYLVDAMVRVCATVWGGEDTNKTPLLKRCLRSIFHVLAENKLSFLEAVHLIDSANPAIRKYLTRNLEDATIQNEWDNFNKKKPVDFDADFFSTRNRLMEFTHSPIIRNIIGQTESTIDFRKVMDEGCILLVNLGAKNRLSSDNARLLGALIVNDLFLNARGRPKGSKAFHVYIDECGRFINEDIANILDEGRKFGLHLTLAHQHLEQLKKAGNEIYHAVMTDAKTKVVFGGLNFEDAEIMAKNVFLGELDLEQWKAGLVKPTVTSYNRTWFENYGKSKGTSEGSSYGTSRGRGTSESEGSSFADSETASATTREGKEVNQTASRGSTTSRSYSRGSSTFESESENRSFGSSQSESRGRSEGLEPVMENLSAESYSLDEQVWRAMALMVNQPQQHAIIKLPGQKSKLVKTPSVKDGFARDERVERFKKQTYLTTYYVKTLPETIQEISEREQNIIRLAQEETAGVKPRPKQKPKQEAKEPESSEEPQNADDFGEDGAPPGFT